MDRLNMPGMKNINKTVCNLALLYLLFTLSSCSETATTNPEITVEELRMHIEYLSSDTLQGRYPGTEGDRMAASYIRDRLVEYGLEPLADDGLQKFSLVTGISTGDNNYLEIDGSEVIIGTDYTPMPFSGNGELLAGVVFCGYGFSIDNNNLQWDDYAGIDVTGKWALMLRGDPEPDDPSSPFATPGTDRFKSWHAAEKGAAGVILVSGEKFDESDELSEIRIHQGKVDVPVIQVTRPTANLILAPGGSTLEVLEESLRKNMSPESFNTNISVSAITDLNMDESQTMNVIASIKGNDPLLRNEYIIIGAHYDHLGTGGEGSGSRRPGLSDYHPGADDNASGVAAMLEIAGRLSAESNNLRRSYLLVAFGAEEKGLLGSRYLADNPVVDPGSLKTMINLDMIGRKNDDKTLHIGGVGTSTEGEGLVRKVAAGYDFNTVLSMEGYGPSDHASFYARDIPVFFLTTGAHPDYHTPDDTADKINYDGLQRISNFTGDLAVELGNMDNHLTFREAGPRTSPAPRHGNRRVSLGIMPDFASAGGDGLRADFITPGRPADRAGMQQGDRIVAINGNPVKDIYEYMYRLEQLNTGDIINVEIIRDNKSEILIIQL